MYKSDINNTMALVATWLNSNSLTGNFNKTNFIEFGTVRHNKLKFINYNGFTRSMHAHAGAL